MAWAQKTVNGWKGRYRDPSGTKVYAPGLHRTEKEARQAAEEQERRIDRGEWADPRKSKRTLAEFADRWIERPRREEATTTANLEQAYNKWVKPKWGSWPIGEITREDLQVWFDEIRETRSLSTAQKPRTLLNKIFTAARRDGWVATNPAEGINLGADDSVARPYPPMEAVLSIAEELEDLHDSTLVLFARTAGPRPSEIAAVRLEDFDFTRNRVYIQEATVEAGGKRVTKGPKTNAGERIVPVPASVMERIAEISFGLQPQDPVFTSARGRPLRPGNFQRYHLGPARERAGVPPTFDLHSMRHGAISDWAQTRSAKTLFELMAWAGHADLRSVQRYAHYYSDVDGSQVDAIDAMLRRGTPENVIRLPRRRQV